MFCTKQYNPLTILLLLQLHGLFASYKIYFLTSISAYKIVRQTFQCCFFIFQFPTILKNVNKLQPNSDACQSHTAVQDFRQHSDLFIVIFVQVRLMTSSAEISLQHSANDRKCHRKHLAWTYSYDSCSVSIYKAPATFN